MKAIAMKVASTLTAPIAQVVAAVWAAGRGEAGGGEDVVGIVDDRVDAGDLLQDRKPEADFERRPPARLEHVGPRRCFVLGAQRRLYCGKPRVGVVLGPESDKIAAGVIGAAGLDQPARRLKSGQNGERE